MWRKRIGGKLISALSTAIVEHSDDAIISKNVDGTVITWNLGAEHIFGYTAAEMIGCPITRLFPSDRWNEETDLVARLQLGEKISHFHGARAEVRFQWPTSPLIFDNKKMDNG
jgi:PAS domain S-box-containing protein